MRLLVSTDIALRVLMRLSADPRVHLSTDALATELVVSRNHLHKIVQFLTELGLVRTIRGAHGGVMLARPANKIRVGEVIQSYEQDQALVECFRSDGGACTLLPRCRLRGMLAAAKSVFYEHLNQYTLADCHLAGSNLSIRSKGEQHRSLNRKKLKIRSPKRSLAAAKRKV
jgi:Rrf2 family nitric oxide-sensitive transcriptional repressor